jgi:hypothetical protein
MWDPGFVEILFSFVFVLLGSLTFHISALISGVSIFRDLPPHLATAMALSVGIILFGISPLSFLTLGPYLQGSISTLPPPDGPPPTNMNLLLEQRAILQNFVTHVIRLNTLLPFILSAAGLGLLAGSLIRLRARAMFLQWFKKKTNLLFGIQTYELSWDGFFSSIKIGGEVTIHMQNEVIKGELRSFSIRNEPQAVRLENYVCAETESLLSYGDKAVQGEILIRTDEITKVSAPYYSFHKHHDEMRHLSQGFYVILSSLGLFLLSRSLQGTSQFLSQPEFADILSPIKDGFSVLSICFLIVALIFLWIAAVVARDDCATWRGALDIYPEYYAFVVLLTAAFIYLSVDTLARSITYYFPVLVQYGIPALISGGAAALIFVLLLFRNQRRVRDAFKKILKSDRVIEGPRLDEFLDEVYKKTDLNALHKERKQTLPAELDEQFYQYWHDADINSALADLVKDRPHLIKEFYGLLLRFRLWKKQEQMRGR